MRIFDVTELSALEILDSRGRPTLAVTAVLADGTVARAGCRRARRPDRGRQRSSATATRPGTADGAC
jgi:enolase